MLSEDFTFQESNKYSVFSWTVIKARFVVAGDDLLPLRKMWD